MRWCGRQHQQAGAADTMADVAAGLHTASVSSTGLHMLC
jgi:hypothetical protein